MAVAGGHAAAGVVPIENSLAGSVLETYDLLLEHDLLIVGEVIVPVKHALLAPAGTTLEQVRRCHSHPQALAQCMPFLRRHRIEALNALNTAAAARDLAAGTIGSGGEPGTTAVIASERAARLYGLAVLATDIQARSDNTTRFVIVSRDECSTSTPATKVSLVYTTHNEPGALYRSLGLLAQLDLNLTRIESRPTRDTLWEYYFYIDFERASGAAFSRDELHALVATLDRRLGFARLLGGYRADRGENLSSTA